MVVYNLKDDRVMEFDRANGLYAVCFCWAEENQRMSLWSRLVHEDAGMEEFKREGFPVVAGGISIACGDWVAGQDPKPPTDNPTASSHT